MLASVAFAAYSKILQALETSVFAIVRVDAEGPVNVSSGRSRFLVTPLFVPRPM